MVTTLLLIDSYVKYSSYFKMEIKHFVSSGSDLKQVDAGGDGQIVGVNTADTIHCLKSTVASSYEKVGTVSWNDLPGSLMYFSCGPIGCWGVNMNFDIFYTVNSSFTSQLYR